MVKLPSELDFPPSVPPSLLLPFQTLLSYLLDIVKFQCSYLSQALNHPLKNKVAYRPLEFEIQICNGVLIRHYPSDLPSYSDRAT